MGPRTKPIAHYEAAFEDYLRRNGLPYIAVDEAKKALFAGAKLKSFDFVVYRPQGKNLLVDVKGRKLPANPKSSSLQNWTTREDIDDLRQWQDVFGDSFAAVFLFLYDAGPSPDNLPSPLKDAFLFRDHWYASLALTITDYRNHMRPRSEAWGTVHLPTKDFRSLAKPFEDWL